MSPTENGADVWLVVGLGNPGPSYAGTRHNVGHLVTDELARRLGGSWRAPKTVRADVLEGRLGAPGTPAPRLVLARPRCYMNESGGPVKALMTFFSVEVDRLLVIHDELDIPAGDVRLKKGGGEGGHNGLRSISSALGTKDYLRVRVGIGRPPGRMDAAEFVLRDFGTTERKELPFLLGDAADAAEMVVVEGLVAAQQKYHSPA